MKIILSALCLLSFSGVFAQNLGKINGVVLKGGQPAEGATVSLLKAKDSSTVKISVASKSGEYFFEGIANGNYLVAAGAAGHKRNASRVFEVSTSQQHVQLPVITLQPVSKDLGGVTVTAKKPLIEQRIDRTIVNVDASITNIGSTAMEILEKSPGITVDRDGNISLKGKEGVMVLIDGRPSQLSGADLANLLRNMGSGQLDQIEIMTNPPARYDAAGNAGIINIKTKKAITAGYNGTLNATYTQGRYAKVQEGFNFNYREKKVNVFSSLSHNYRKGFEKLTINRNIYNNANTLERYFDQQVDKMPGANVLSAKAGLDYFATKKSTFGIVLNKTGITSDIDYSNVTDILTPAKELESITKATVANDNRWKSFSANLNFRTQLNAKGRELTSDIDFLNYGTDNRQFMVNSYFDASGNTSLQADTLKGYLPQDIKVYSGRLDYLQPLKKKNARFEGGIKSSIVRTDNNATYDSIQNGLPVRDFNRSNHFIYEENINAAYVNLSTPLSKKLSAQLGLRLENTNAKGTQVTTGERFDRHYTQLFPTAFLQYQLSEKSTLGANYGRRVRRPDYHMLNPFIRFIDRYTYNQGNPNLEPQISNNIELAYNYKNAFSATLNYTSTTDIISNTIEQRGQEAFTKPANIASQYQFGIALNANTPITKWWTSNTNVNAFSNKFEGLINNLPVSLSANSYIINTVQQFKLSKNTSAEINGRYRSGWQEGVMRARAIGFVGAGLSHQIMKGKGTLKITARDIFYTQNFRASAKYNNVDFNLSELGDSRIVAIGFSYKFSKGKKVAPVKRTAGSAGEEQERIGGGN